MDLVKLRQRIDGVIDRLIPYSSCKHILIGLSIWSVAFSFSCTDIEILSYGTLIAFMIEVFQRVTKTGTFELRDVFYTEVGIGLPMIAVFIRGM